MSSTSGDNPRYLAKIPTTPEGKLALQLLRKYINRDAGTVRMCYSGPRPNGKQSGRAGTATHYRIYFDTHELKSLTKQFYATRAEFLDFREYVSCQEQSIKYHLMMIWHLLKQKFRL